MFTGDFWTLQKYGSEPEKHCNGLPTDATPQHAINRTWTSSGSAVSIGPTGALLLVTGSMFVAPISVATLNETGPGPGVLAEDGVTGGSDACI